MIDAWPDSLTLIMESVIPLLITIAIPVALYVSYRKVQNDAKRAKEIAALLGLHYMNEADNKRDGKGKDSFFMNLLSRWSPWAMEGTYKGARVRVELVLKTIQQRYTPTSTSVGSSSNATRTSYSRYILYSVPFDEPLPFTMGIGRAMSMPFGLKADSLETGDADFDRMVMITGSEKDEILDWLGSGRRLDVLKKLFQERPSVLVTSSGLELREDNTRIDYDRLRGNLSLLSRACVKLGE